MTAPSIRRPAGSAPRRERGMVLVVVLAVLALMFLAGIGVLRITGTGNVVAANFSFQQQATLASDRAITDALNTLAGIVPSGGGNNPVANRYVNVEQAVDAKGIPTTINWANVTCVDETGVVVTDCAADSGKFRVQYFIERRCSSNPDFTSLPDIRAKCEYEPTTSAAGAATIALRYRVLIRVRGPRGTDGYYEAMVSGPAST
jgi:type IV pilus assembly protein PilX